MLEAMRAGADILRAEGSALDAVTATVRVLEDHPLFNAGLGSLLTVEGTVEMDAAVMVAEAPPARGIGSRAPARRANRRTKPRAGAVATVTRVRNPILLARAVMEHTPHILMAGAGAERLARRAAIELCRPEELITQRARQRWRAALESRVAAARSILAGPGDLGTVGAVALDVRGAFAAATSTGGVSGKLSGRVGDSAIIGAGTFADACAAASATGQGEAIMQVALCREAVAAVRRAEPQSVTARMIRALGDSTGGQAGIILVDARGRFGFAHNAEAMDVAMFEPAGGFDYRWVEPIDAVRRRGHGSGR